MHFHSVTEFCSFAPYFMQFSFVLHNFVANFFNFSHIKCNFRIFYTHLLLFLSLSHSVTDISVSSKHIYCYFSLFYPRSLQFLFVLHQSMQFSLIMPLRHYNFGVFEQKINFSTEKQIILSTWVIKAYICRYNGKQKQIMKIVLSNDMHAIV